MWDGHYQILLNLKHMMNLRAYFAQIWVLYHHQIDLDVQELYSPQLLFIYIIQIDQLDGGCYSD